MRSVVHSCFAVPARWLGQVLLCALLLTGSAWAQDHILDKAYWTDPSGSASFEQAREAAYTPYTGVLSKGFGKQAQWVRLQIGAVAPGNTDSLVLRIRPVFLDSITLYDPADLAQGQAARTTGDTTPFSATEFESLHHAFVIPAQPAPRTVWVRLVTNSTQLMHIEALTPREMLRQEHNLWLAYSALLAGLLSCLLLVFIAFLQKRDAVNGFFVLRQSVLLAYTVCHLGYQRVFLSSVMSAETQDQFYNWLVLMTTSLSLGFEYSLLSGYKMPHWGRRLLQILLGVCALSMLLMLLGLKLEALSLNMLNSGLGLSSLLLIALAMRTEPAHQGNPATYHLPKLALLGYYLGIALAITLSILSNLGLFQGNMLSLYGILLYGLISGVYMTTLLIVRSRQMERLQREQTNNLFLSREQLAQETRRRQDQSQLLNMLMHELKTPLAVIDLALKDRSASDKAQGYVGRAIDNMQAILQRCVQTDRLVDRPFEAQRQRFDLAQQLQQWVQDHKQGEGRIALQLPSAAPVETDLQCVHIICSNLIENALKYGDAQRPINVSLEARSIGQPGVCLQVRNAPGKAGLPDADQVFAKYYRSPAAQRQSGTGLGLFLSHNLAQQIGAQLRHIPGDNSICFELWLPT